MVPTTSRRRQYEGLAQPLPSVGRPPLTVRIVGSRDESVVDAGALQRRCPRRAASTSRIWRCRSASTRARDAAALRWRGLASSSIGSRRSARMGFPEPAHTASPRFRRLRCCEYSPRVVTPTARPHTMHLTRGLRPLTPRHRPSTCRPLALLANSHTREPRAPLVVHPSADRQN